MKKFIDFLDDYTGIILSCIVAVAIGISVFLTALNHSKPIDEQVNRLYQEAVDSKLETVKLTDISKADISISEKEIFITYSEKECKLTQTYDKNTGELITSKVEDLRLGANLKDYVIVAIAAAFFSALGAVILTWLLTTIGSILFYAKEKHRDIDH